MFKNLQKLLSKHALIIAVGVVVLYLVVTNYSAHKGTHSEGNSAATSGGSVATVPQVVPAHPAGENEVSASVAGITTSSLGLPQAAVKEHLHSQEIFCPKQEIMHGDNLCQTLVTAI